MEILPASWPDCCPGPDSSNCGLHNAWMPGVSGLTSEGLFGPGGAPAGNACDSHDGSTTVSPFATKPVTVKVLKP